MMLMTLDEVKARFPRWELFVRLDAAETAAQLDERLTRIAEDAEAQLTEYAGSLRALTPPLARHLMVLVQKGAFDVQHGNTAFEHKPQVVRDYEQTLAALERYRTGELHADAAPAADQRQVSMTARPRRFNEWFQED